jgi:hypothetical protein
MLSAALSSRARALAAPLVAGILLAAAPALHAPPPAAPAAPAVHAGALSGGYIEQVWSEFDVWRSGYKGMVVHVRFHANGLLNVPCRAVAYFAYEGGQALRDFDGSYSTTDGKVSTSTTFTPGYENALYSDLQIFMPYEQLHMSDNGSADLEYHVELYAEDYGNHFAISRAVRFHYSQ